MAKVYPYIPSSSSSSSESETFTIWMKSLVINGNGYTVYDSNGKVVYRIDNYDSKCSNEVYLMDLRGNVLCTMLRNDVFPRPFNLFMRKLLRSGLWDGYKCNGPKVKNDKPWFQVRKNRKFLKKDLSYIINVGCDEGERRCYKIEGFVGKSDFKITDSEGRVVAEAKQKQSSCCGVVLGEDVLSLKVEPLVDHSFVMALVAVYGLVRHKM